MDKSKLPELFEKLTLMREFAHEGNSTAVLGLNKSLSDVQDDVFGDIHYEEGSLNDLVDICKNNYLESTKSNKNALSRADKIYEQIRSDLNY